MLQDGIEVSTHLQSQEVFPRHPREKILVYFLLLQDSKLLTFLDDKSMIAIMTKESTGNWAARVKERWFGKRPTPLQPNKMEVTPAMPEELSSALDEPYESEPLTPEQLVLRNQLTALLNAYDLSTPEVQQQMHDELAGGEIAQVPQDVLRRAQNAADVSDALNVGREQGLYYSSVFEDVAKALDEKRTDIGQPNLETTEGLVDFMRSSTSEQDWNERCDIVKAQNHGAYPPNWFPAIVMSGVMNEAQQGWDNTVDAAPSQSLSLPEAKEEENTQMQDETPFVSQPVKTAEELEQHLLEGLTGAAQKGVDNLGYDDDASVIAEMYQSTGNPAFLKLLEDLAKEDHSQEE